METYCGIDLGTSSVKVLLVNADGSVTEAVSREYEIIKESPKRAEQNMDYLWEKTVECLKELAGKNPKAVENIRGIGFSGQMHGLVPIDKQGRPVRNAIIWADQRSFGQLESLYNRIPRREFQEEICSAPAPGFMLVSLLWMQETEPENFHRTNKVLLPKDYIRYRLCGEIGSDATDASATGIFDTKKRRWAYGWMKRIGIPENLFPPCKESWEVAGEVTAAAAGMTGLKKGTKVVYGGGDTMMQLVGNGILAPGIFSCNIGTASQIACAVESPLHDEKFRTNTFCHAGRKLWEIQGSSLTGGAALKWLKEKVLFLDSFEQMERLAGQAPAGSDGLLFLPYLSGERCPHQDSSARGIYHGLSLYHSREHLIRSTMEGVLFGLRESLEIFREMGISPVKMLASGGGARGRLFREMQADIFDCEIFTSRDLEQACLGAAISAAVGTGGFSTYEEACQRMTAHGRDAISPNPKRVIQYEACYARYKELYPRNKPLFS